MAAILSNLRNTVIAGLVLTVIMVIVVSQTPGADKFAVDHGYATFFSSMAARIKRCNVDRFTLVFEFCSNP